MLDWQKEYHARRRLRIRQMLAVGILAVVVLFFVSLGLIQEVRASHELKELQLKQQKELEAKQKELEKTEATADTAEETDRSKLANLKSLVPKFSCKNVTEKSREEIDKINKILQIDCGHYQDVVANPEETLSAPRVYFQIQTEDQRDSAQDLKQWLTAQKINGRKILVPGIENVGPRNLRTSQLRYFHNDPSEVNWAWLVIKSLQNVCVNVPSPQLIKGYEDSTAIKPLHFELWLTPDALNNLGCNAKK